jgi:hypothetical protein
MASTNLAGFSENSRYFKKTVISRPNIRAMPITRIPANSRFEGNMTPNPRRNRLIVSSKVKSAPESYTDTGPDFRWAVSVRMGSDESGGKLAGFHRMKS